MHDQDREFQKERDRVQFIIDTINHKMDQLQENVGGLKEGIIDLRKSFWEDVTVNLDDAHEIGETFTSIKQQVELLAERERTHKQFYSQMKSLLRLKSSPYFGRVDFLEDGDRHVEPIYIGLSSLMDEKDEEFLIYDWRAPISSLYYNYSPGPAEYDVMDETIHGTMELKRQYIIKRGQLKSMFDTGITIGDELLQEVLSNNADSQMKSIVATIQKEQNQIIRNETCRYLVVQGVAGSGKTSAALQRIAYLLYRYRGQINADNIMLFSPNFLFNSYVSTVLPELGEENMKQSTFQAYVEGRLGKKFSVEDAFTQMEYLYTAEKDELYHIRLSAIKYKSSLKYVDFMNKYIEHLSTQDLLFRNITFHDNIIVPAKDIENYFYSLDKAISIPNRMKKTAEWLLVNIKKIEEKERKKEWVMKESELLDKEDYLTVYRELQGGKRGNSDTFDDYELEQKLLSKIVTDRHFKPVKNSIKKFRFLDIISLYFRVFNEETVGFLPSVTVPENWKDICEVTMNELKQNRFMYEDATAFLYLKDKLEGRKSSNTIRHLFIDEAQDYSPFQFEFLKQLYPNCHMTILGDLNQAIFAHSHESPTLLTKELFVDQDNYERITLTRSYRSTKQIMDFAKGILDNNVEPFNRNGETPSLTIVDDKDALHHNMRKSIDALEKKEHTTIAILCKTAEESERAYEALVQEKTEISLIDKESHTFTKGVLIMPAYLAKGIEFDAVVIYDASNEVYGEEIERKLFYTACTRAMHELHLFSVGTPSLFLEDVSKESYVKL
ncbi:RNA polymerase recycling motor HelD [Evansella sp. AB-rgal1]|uniref:RNA polymerase recycling motor HelD n=1 Tax=Evansella sp. AB-rgal1 TaxID=3242696 RepID=UPI00359DE2ED